MITLLCGNAMVGRSVLVSIMGVNPGPGLAQVISDPEKMRGIDFQNQYVLLYKHSDELVRGHPSKRVMTRIEEELLQRAIHARAHVIYLVDHKSHTAGVA